MIDAVTQLEELDRILRILYEERFEEYCSTFSSNTEFTSFISTIVEDLAAVLKLYVQHEYYSIDHVLYKEEDIVENRANTWVRDPHSEWLKRFRVILEHENHLDGRNGGYQEFSHLMVTNADSKILIGYGSQFDNYDVYAMDYESLMKSLDYEPQPILFIGEYEPISDSSGQSSLLLESYIISKRSIRKFNPKELKWEPLEIM